MQNIKKDYLWNSLGSLLQSAISPVLLIIITRLNGIDDSGLFSFALSLSVVFWAVSLWVVGHIKYLMLSGNSQAVVMLLYALSHRSLWQFPQ